MEKFLSEHGVDTCLLNETNLEAGRDLRFANYVVVIKDFVLPVHLTVCAALS
jgi:hypothetical protein